MEEVHAPALILDGGAQSHITVIVRVAAKDYEAARQLLNEGSCGYILIWTGLIRESLIEFPQEFSERLFGRAASKGGR